MKTKTWILLLSILLVLSAGLSLWLLWPRADAAFVEVWSDGKLLYQLDLRVDRQITVEGEQGLRHLPKVRFLPRIHMR